MLNYDEVFFRAIEKVKSEGRYREFVELERSVGTFPQAAKFHQGTRRPVTVWCSNDYLGQGHNPVVVNAAAEAVRNYGTGAGGTRNISGTNTLHSKLEKTLAQLHGKPAALTFTSGYIANETTLATLAGLMPDCVIFSDEDNHASMIAGIRNSRAKKEIFKHNDVDDLERRLNAYPREQAKIVAFESVYSMDGDIGRVSEICEVSRAFGALTYLDEVHAVGMYGDHGAGIAERDDAVELVDVVQGTLGKAFGCMGGYIAGSVSLVDAVRSYAPGFIFTTALPPAVTGAAIASIEYLMGKEGTQIRASHQEKASLLKTKLRERNLPIMENDTHIVPILIKDPVLCKQASQYLLEDYNIYIQPINYPTVPAGTERLRVTATPLHDEGSINTLVDALDVIWDRLGIRRASYP